MDNLAYRIDYHTEEFDTSSVHAFRDAACAVARQKPNSLELQCWNLIDELDGREVRLAEEGMGKERFSVGSDEVISLLQISTDYSLDFIDPDRPIEVACACIARHPDYIPQVASAVRENAQQIPEGSTELLMQRVCCGLRKQNGAGSKAFWIRPLGVSSLPVLKC
ncbi:MAG: hypothetical protein AB7S81_01840 [Bdellovibrionales bacterium]